MTSTAMPAPLDQIMHHLPSIALSAITAVVAVAVSQALRSYDAWGFVVVGLAAIAAGTTGAFAWYCWSMKQQQLTTKQRKAKEFLETLHLDSYWTKFLDKGWDSMELILAMDDLALQDVGLQFGHISKFHRAASKAKSELFDNAAEPTLPAPSPSDQIEVYSAPKQPCPISVPAIAAPSEKEMSAEPSSRPEPPPPVSQRSSLKRHGIHPPFLAAPVATPVINVMGPADVLAVPGETAAGGAQFPRVALSPSVATLVAGSNIEITSPKEQYSDAEPSIDNQDAAAVFKADGLTPLSLDLTADALVSQLKSGPQPDSAVQVSPSQGNPCSPPPMSISNSERSLDTIKDGSNQVSGANECQREGDTADPVVSQEHVLDATKQIRDLEVADWRCANQVCDHDFFMSYRVRNDKESVRALYCAMMAKPHSYHIYFDELCLNNGQDWEIGFINGLKRSKVILLFVSEGGLERMKLAHEQPDNLLLEWELSLDLENAIVQPILIDQIVQIDDETYSKPFFPLLSEFPDKMPIHPRSSRKKTIRRILEDLMKKQAVKLSYSGGARQLVSSVLELRAKLQHACESKTTEKPAIQSLMLTAKEETQLLSLLRPFHQTAELQAQRELYAKDTRLWLCEEVMEWVEKGQGLLWWIMGESGIGKSVFSSLLIHELKARGQLAGYYFCKGNHEERSRVRNLIQTLVFQMALWNAAFGRQILSSGWSLSGMECLNSADLFGCLITGSLRQLRKNGQKDKLKGVFVIDGLDECPERTQLLDILTRDGAEASLSGLKFLLTARSDTGIQGAVPATAQTVLDPRSSRNREDAMIYIVRQLKSHVDQADISAVAQQMLEQSKGNFMWIRLATDTLLKQDESQKKGVKAKIGAFFKNIRDKSPLSRKRSLLDDSDREPRIRLTTGHLHPFRKLDINQLYGRIFDALFEIPRDAPAKAPEREQLQSLLRVLGAAMEPMRLQVLMDFTGLSRQDSKKYIRKLSLVVCPEIFQNWNANVVEFNHRLVTDFLSNVFLTANKEYSLVNGYHAQMAIASLELILKQPKPANICGLKRKHDEIADIDELVERHISRSVKYSCIYWVDHIARAKEMNKLNRSQEGQVCVLVRQLLSSHLLYWIEVLSLVNEPTMALRKLQQLKRLLLFDSARQPLAALTNKDSVVDLAIRQLVVHQDAIAQFAPELYVVLGNCFVEHTDSWSSPRCLCVPYALDLDDQTGSFIAERMRRGARMPMESAMEERKGDGGGSRAGRPSRHPCCPNCVML
ncbi:uncharacterized protein BJ171DRAFT_500760 [Polychytrium aggregatum]|uniref:uncharacterized protein n=1 Tax=Polychytrium aggregatum TaxID=110093 RepID=UPI0022FF1F70|nr:uncharacterized protein BJ171DRAFT_500760 [Polychytrium aggregatum]KAI9205553.1 hypothetical protein BJ171DRAFT_500760 [Polychytrium aggregatum]